MLQQAGKCCLHRGAAGLDNTQLHHKQYAASHIILTLAVHTQLHPTLFVLQLHTLINNHTRSYPLVMRGQSPHTLPLSHTQTQHAAALYDDSAAAAVLVVLPFLVLEGFTASLSTAVQAMKDAQAARTKKMF